MIIFCHLNVILGHEETSRQNFIVIINFKTLLIRKYLTFWRKKNLDKWHMAKCGTAILINIMYVLYLENMCKSEII